jgi:hypothetical protein
MLALVPLPDCSAGKGGSQGGARMIEPPTRSKAAEAGFCIDGGALMI